MAEFDFCITGAGCAGLSLLVRMLREPTLRDKRILLVDRVAKTTSDRTWCFWESSPGFFEEIVAHRWSGLWFHGSGQSRLLPASPFTYKMIRSIDFYRFCFDRLRQYPNVTVRCANIDGLHSDSNATFAIVDGRKITAGRIFNSIPFSREEGTSDNHWHLLQHFKGWVIRTLQPVFVPGEATLMDFRTAQDSRTAFFYVMPFSATQALVEYTVFSTQVLEEAGYTNRLIEYISKILNIRHFSIVEREFGVIPMTTRPFPRDEKNIRHIGAAGGMTKPSTGYTFQRVQYDSEAIVRSLVHPAGPAFRATPGRFNVYDRILLNVLMTNKLSGEEVFSRLFTANALPDLFAFLDDASHPGQDWKIIRSLPAGPFAKAAVQEVLGYRGV